MSICRRKIPPHRLMTLGLVMLAAANVGHWIIQKHSGWPESVADASSGLLMGVAIATTLLGIWMSRR